MAVATAVKKWTLEELHSLPDDGNKYELIRGELFVTPPPTFEHETIAAKLSRVLDPFVERHNLGYVYHPKSVMRFEGSEVEPDLMVLAARPKGTVDWDNAPVPLLVVEILSPSTRRRDHEHKRRFYLDAGVEEYWIVDGEAGTVRCIRAGAADVVQRERLTWLPSGASQPLDIEVPSLFR